MDNSIRIWDLNNVKCLKNIHQENIRYAKSDLW